MLVELPVELPMGRVPLEKPRNVDDLISEVDFAEDDRLRVLGGSLAGRDRPGAVPRAARALAARAGWDVW